MESLRDGYLCNNPSPWIAFQALDWIAERMRPNMRIFEYGSGGSTLYWLSHKAILTSIEHDSLWFNTIKARLPFDASIDYRLSLPALREISDGPGDPANPMSYSTADVNFANYQFRSYAAEIDMYPCDYFDIVLIDGRARPSCIFHSYTKLKPGGMLILDNSDRNYYTQQLQDILRSFNRIDFWGVGPCVPTLWGTSIYLKNG